MELGENIYRLRTQRRMSQGDLADALDISRQSVSKWETGSAVPELDKLIKMSKLFGVSLDSLVGEDPSASTPVPAPAGKSITIRQIIGAFLLCLAIGILIYFSITVSYGLEAGIYFGLVLSSAGAALCWPKNTKVQICFCILDGLFLLILTIMQQDFLSALIFGIPFAVIYGFLFMLKEDPAQSEKP